MTDHPGHTVATTETIGFRDELLGKGWPDARHVAELAGLSTEHEDTAGAIEVRATGALLGVWSAPQNRFIYPDFKFNRLGTLRKDSETRGSVLIMPTQSAFLLASATAATFGLRRCSSPYSQPSFFPLRFAACMTERAPCINSVRK